MVAVSPRTERAQPIQDSRFSRSLSFVSSGCAESKFSRDGVCLYTPGRVLGAQRAKRACERSKKMDSNYAWSRNGNQIELCELGLRELGGSLRHPPRSLQFGNNHLAAQNQCW